MPLCSNPECPHRKKTGKPAEFVDGIAFCSDCGSALSAKIVNSNFEKNPTPSNFWERMLYTIGLVLLWRVLVMIPVPGINFEALGGFLDRTGGDIFFASLSSVSVFALGIMPYVSAYVLVEILALFVPPLKSWREGGYEGRTKLKRTALVATFILGIVQGYGIATGIESMGNGQFAHNPGWNFHLMLALTLTTGTFITIWIAELITRNGIGHGISILILAGLAVGFFQRVPILFSKIGSEIYEHSPFLLVIALGIALIALVVFAEKSHRRIPVKFDDGKEAYIPLKLTTAGIVPVSWAASIVMLPVTIFSFTNNPSLQKIAVELSPGKLAYFP